MNTNILGGNPIWEKTTAIVVFVFNIYYIKNCLQYCTDANSYQYAGIYLHNATTFSHFPTATVRELQPPNLIYQPLLEGSFNPQIRTPASIGRKLLLPY